MAASTNASTGTAPQAATASQGMAPSSEWVPAASTRHKRRTRAKIAAVALACSLYAGGVAYFSSHFVPGTTVNGIRAGQMTTTELADALTERVSSYEQHITNDNGFDATISGSEVSLACNAQQTADEAMGRTNAVLWPLHLLAPQHMLIDAGTTYDTDALSKAVEEAVSAYNETAEPPTNAAATYDEEQGVYVTTPASTGEALSAAQVTETSGIACRGLREEVSLDATALAQPTRAEDDEGLLAVIAQANDSLSKDLDLVSDGQVVHTVTAQDKRAWLTVTDEIAVAVDGHAIFEWLGSQDDIVAAGNASDDERVWQFDQLDTACNIALAIRDAKDGPVEISRTLIEEKPAVTPGAKELGRHVDVNLTTQFARFYNTDGTVIWDSYLVSGGWDYEKGIMHETPTGTFYLEAKMTNQTLIGADLDGDEKPDYESFVNYWMPFLNNDVGFHDATWRYEFGGNIRSWWGSHGCINLPYDKAVELWNLINVGDMVVVHN